MRQRIKLAQALAHEPRLLILDEPFTGTDPVGRRELADLLKKLASNGVDILLSSHVLHEVEALTHQILMIDQGRIVAEGDLRAVRRRMLGRPHSIRIRIDDPRKLAARLAPLKEVIGLRMNEGETLIVETVAPDSIHDVLPKLILDEGMVVREIAADDENLEAVFGYLTDRTTYWQENH
jgi:ABC-2 type transport system ATP-binding protein